MTMQVLLLLHVAALRINEQLSDISLAEGETGVVPLRPLFLGVDVDFQVRDCQLCSLLPSMEIREEARATVSGLRLGPSLETPRGLVAVLVSARAMEIRLVRTLELLHTIKTQEDIEGTGVYGRLSSRVLIFWTRAPDSLTARLFFVDVENSSYEPSEIPEIAQLPIEKLGIAVCADSLAYVSAAMRTISFLQLDTSTQTLSSLHEAACCLPPATVLSTVCDEETVAVLTTAGLFRSRGLQQVPVAGACGKPVALKAAHSGITLIAERGVAFIGAKQRYFCGVAAPVDVTSSVSLLLRESNGELLLSRRTADYLGAEDGSERLPVSLSAASIRDVSWLAFRSHSGQLLLLTADTLFSFKVAALGPRLALKASPQPYEVTVCASEAGGDAECQRASVLPAPEAALARRVGMRLSPLPPSLSVQTLTRPRSSHSILLSSLVSGPNLSYSLRSTSPCSLVQPEFFLYASITMQRRGLSDTASCRASSDMLAFLESNTIAVRKFGDTEDTVFFADSAVEFLACLVESTFLYAVGVRDGEERLYANKGDRLVVVAEVEPIDSLLKMTAVGQWLMVAGTSRVDMKYLYKDEWEALPLADASPVLDAWLDGDSLLVLHSGLLEVFSRLAWRYHPRALFSVPASLRRVAYSAGVLVAMDAAGTLQMFSLAGSSLTHLRAVETQCEFQSFESISKDIAMRCRGFLQILGLDPLHLDPRLLRFNTPHALLRKSDEQTGDVTEVFCDLETCTARGWHLPSFLQPSLHIVSTEEANLTVQLLVTADGAQSANVTVEWFLSMGGSLLSARDIGPLTLAWEDSLTIPASSLVSGYDVRLSSSAAVPGLSLAAVVETVHTVSLGSKLACGQPVASPSLRTIFCKTLDSLSAISYSCAKTCTLTHQEWIAATSLGLRAVTMLELLFTEGTRAVLHVSDAVQYLVDLLVVYDTDGKTASVIYRREGEIRGNFLVVRRSSEVVAVYFYEDYVELFTLRVGESGISLESVEEIAGLFDIVSMGSSQGDATVLSVDSQHRLWKLSSDLQVTFLNYTQAAALEWLGAQCLFALSASGLEIFEVPTLQSVRRIPLPEAYWMASQSQRAKVSAGGRFLVLTRTYGRTVLIDTRATAGSEVVALLPFMLFEFTGEDTAYSVDYASVAMLRLQTAAVVIAAGDSLSDNDSLVNLTATNSLGSSANCSFTLRRVSRTRRKLLWTGLVAGGLLALSCVLRKRRRGEPQPEVELQRLAGDGDS